MAIFTVNMARFLQRTVERAYRNIKTSQWHTLGLLLVYRGCGFVRAAGEEWIAEPSGPHRLSAEILARSCHWLLVGIDTSSRIIESH